MSGRTTFRLGTVRGIPVELHISFVLVWGLFLWMQDDPWSRTGWISSVLYLMLLFCSIVFHEMSHALVARRWGIETREITFYPIGGVARLVSLEPPAPRAEIAIALAGPAGSFALAALFYALFALQNLLGWYLPPILGRAVLYGLLLNLAVGLFNLVPAFPLDGGRIFRAALALWLPYRRATAIATRIGRTLAIALIFGGAFVSPLWSVMGGVLLVVAASEARSLALLDALRSAQVADAMSPADPLLAPHLAVAELPPLPQKRPYYAVVDPVSRRLLGLVRHHHIELAREGPGHRLIGELLIPLRTSTHPTASLFLVFEMMHRRELGAVPVLFGREVVGILTWTDLHEFALTHGRRAG